MLNIRVLAYKQTDINFSVLIFPQFDDFNQLSPIFFFIINFIYKTTQMQFIFPSNHYKPLTSLANDISQYSQDYENTFEAIAQELSFQLNRNQFKVSKRNEVLDESFQNLDSPCNKKQNSFGELKNSCVTQSNGDLDISGINQRLSQSFAQRDYRKKSSMRFLHENEEVSEILNNSLIINKQKNYLQKNNIDKINKQLNALQKQFQKDIPLDRYKRCRFKKIGHERKLLKKIQFGDENKLKVSLAFNKGQQGLGSQKKESTSHQFFIDSKDLQAARTYNEQLYEVYLEIYRHYIRQQQENESLKLKIRSAETQMRQKQEVIQQQQKQLELLKSLIDQQDDQNKKDQQATLMKLKQKSFIKSKSHISLRM